MDLSQLLEHRVVEKCMALFNSNGTYRKNKKQNKLSLQYVKSCKKQKACVSLVDMGMIWSKATPRAEDRLTQDDNTYKWSDYLHKVSSIILARHGDADRISCMDDGTTVLLMNTLAPTAPTCQPATVTELQISSVWGWHCPLLRLRSHFSMSHWFISYNIVAMCTTQRTRQKTTQAVLSINHTYGMPTYNYRWLRVCTVNS